MNTKSYLESACEGIDACVFSGDEIHDATKRQMLRDYIGRWQREMTELEGAKPIERFTVKQYVGDTLVTLKGNGFDGLKLEQDRDEVQALIDWINEQLGNAARYRYIADSTGLPDAVLAALDCGSKTLLDTAIDAELKKAKP